MRIARFGTTLLAFSLTSAASFASSGWSNSYASAEPVERVTWVHATTRHDQNRPSMRWQ
jgi:hypothetical protein